MAFGRFFMVPVLGGDQSGCVELPSHRFNPPRRACSGWGVGVPAPVLVGSGLILEKQLPDVAYLRSDRQVAHMVHAVAAVMMNTTLLGHVYIGTIGACGAFKTMKTGYVNEGWDREYQALWPADAKAGKIPLNTRRHPPTPRVARPRRPERPQASGETHETYCPHGPDRRPQRYRPQ